MNIFDLDKKIKFSQKLAIGFFVVLFLSWIILQFFYKGELSNYNLFWAASYQIIALVGGIIGLIVSEYWGGTKSLIGKSITFFSIGLLFQVFGQSVFSFYNIVIKVDIPYPSIADIGFLGSTISYIIAALFLGKVVDIHSSLRGIKSFLLTILITLPILVVTYYLFLTGYVFDWSQPLKVALDFGYPVGDAIYVSLGLVALILSVKYLGGIMKWPIFVILMALIFQYVADFNFLYQAYQGTWINGGYGDLLYMCSYFITTLSILGLGWTFNKILNS